LHIPVYLVFISLSCSIYPNQRLNRKKFIISNICRIWSVTLCCDRIRRCFICVSCFIFMRWCGPTYTCNGKYFNYVCVKTEVGLVMCSVFWICYVQYGRGVQAFQNSRSHVKILGARRITGSKFYTEDVLISCATIPHFVTTAIWHLGYAHPFNKGSCLNYIKAFELMTHY
jgi:hypothetical protein